MFDILDKVVGNANFWLELRYHSRKALSFAVENGKLSNASNSIYTGVGVRTLVDGCWGFASTSILSIERIWKAVEEARIAAERSNSMKKRKVSSLPSSGIAKGKFEPTITDDVRNHSVDEKIKLVLGTEKKAHLASKLIVSVSCRYSEMVDEKYIVNSDGAHVHVLDIKPEFRIMTVAMENSEMQMGFASAGVTGGWGELFKHESPEDLAIHSVKIAVNKLKAEEPEGGEATVILDPSLVGVLAHEAIGHTVEADFVLAGSIAKGKIGEKVGSKLVTLVDSGKASIGTDAAGLTLVDDEGIEAKDVIVIDKGILKSYLHNRESAGIFNVEPTGNARAFTYSDEPIIRMRNTYIEPGTSKLDDMIMATKKGYLFKRLGGGGQADANAEFMFGVLEGYKIENGKITSPVKNVTISGQAFDVLKTVDMVSDDFKWGLGAGYCGKMQPAKVDAGGPYLRCRVKIGGNQR